MGTINTDAAGHWGWMSDDSEVYVTIEKWPAAEGSNTWAIRIGTPHATIANCSIELFLYGEHVLDTKQDASPQSALKSLSSFVTAWAESMGSMAELDSENADLFPQDVVRLADYAEEFTMDCMEATRESLSSNHFSVDTQVTDVVKYLNDHHPGLAIAFFAAFPDYAKWQQALMANAPLSQVYEGDTDLDPEYSSWLVEWIEKNTSVYWEEGEPWIND